MTEQEISRMIEDLAELRQGDLTHVRALAKEHNRDLHEWCIRRRRRARYCRMAASACILVFCAFYANKALAQPSRYTNISINGNIDATRTCDAIYTMLGKI